MADQLASKIIIMEEEPRVRTIQGVPTAIAGIVGVAERGPIGVATLVTSFDQYQDIFGRPIAGGYMADAVKGFFENGGQQVYVSRTLHYTDVANAAHEGVVADVTVQTQTGAATPGAVEGSVEGPFRLADSDTLSISVDGGAPTVATIQGTAANVLAGNQAPYVLANEDDLTLKIDGGPVQTVEFLDSEFVDITQATAAEVAAVINAKITGGRTTVSNNRVRITSDLKGTDSSVEITGGSANGAPKLNYTTVEQTGTGNVADLTQVSVAEIKTVVEAAVAGVLVSNVAGKVHIETVDTGPTASVQVAAASTADDEIGFDNATHAGGSGAAEDAFKVKGKHAGAYANALTADVEDASSGVVTEFNLVVKDNGVVVERWANLSIDPTATRYAPNVVNSGNDASLLIAIEDLSPSDSYLIERDTYTPTGGLDGLDRMVDADFIGAGSDGAVALDALKGVQDLRLVLVPDRPTPAVANALITFCEITKGGSCFAILDPPASQDADDVVDYVENQAAIGGSTEFAAIYWPWVKVVNPLATSDATRTVPPSGHVAGVFARTDGAKDGGVYQPPAGVELGILRGVLGFETTEVLDETKRDVVYPHLVNPLTSYPGAAPFIDGTRNLRSNFNFPSVSERRGAIFIEQSLKKGLEFARHKNNTPALRATIARTIEAFLLTQFRQGAFRHSTPAQSYFVDVGDAINPPTEQFARRINVRVGIATAKPTDWIILKFSQDTRALEEEIASASAT